MKKIAAILYFLSLNVWAVSDTDYMTEIIPDSLFTTKTNFLLPANSNRIYFPSEEFGKICSLFYPKYGQDQTLPSGAELRVFAVDYSTGHKPRVDITLIYKNRWMPSLTCEYPKGDGHNLIAPLRIGELRQILADYFTLDLIEE